MNWRHAMIMMHRYCGSNVNILPSWERFRSCAAQGYISFSALLRKTAQQVPAVRKAPLQEGYCYLIG